jgi:hypothetical protein
LEADVITNPAPADHTIQVVGHNRITQARHKVFGLRTLLLIAQQVGFHKDRTSFAEFYRGLTLEGSLGELPVDIYVQPLCLLFQKRTCPRSAGVVHLKINDHAVFEGDILTVLASYLKYSVNLRIDYCSAGGLGGNLVNDYIRPDEITGQIPAGAGACRPKNPDFAGNFPGWPAVIRYALASMRFCWSMTATLVLKEPTSTPIYTSNGSVMFDSRCS